MTLTFTSNTVVGQMPDGWWYAELVDHPGVWDSGRTKQKALDGLPSVLRGWHEGWYPECSCGTGSQLTYEEWLVEETP